MLSGFNLWDIILGVAACWFILRGMMRGLIGEAVSLVGFFLSLFLAFHCHKSAGDALAQALGLNSYAASVVGGIAIWIFISICAFVVRALLKKAVGAAHLGFLDRLLGAVSGIIKTVILIYAIITVGLLLAPVKSPVWLTKSDLIRYFGRYWPAAHSVMSRMLPEHTTLPSDSLEVILRPYRTGSSGPAGYKIRNYRN